MKIAAYQFEVTNDINCNLHKIVSALYQAANEKIELVVFPECCLTGYPPRDISCSSDVNFDMVETACKKQQETARNSKSIKDISYCRNYL